MRPTSTSLWLAGTLAAVLCSLAPAEISLPAVISNHMVLQRDVQVPIWGYGEPGETITVQFVDQTHTAKADENGEWTISLDPLEASATPQTLLIDGSDRIEITDVLVGEVWICGGQSNMEWTIDRSEDPARERADASRPTLRLIKAPHITASTPAKSIDAGWELCTPESVGSFTAIGYAFGRDLQDALDVPVGLLSINWGGTRIEPWISRDSLEAHPRSRDQMETLGRKQDEWAAMSPEDIESLKAGLFAAHARTTASYLDRQLIKDPGVAGKWFVPSIDTSEWKTTSLPREWSTIDPSLGTFDGGLWFRKVVELPASFVGHNLKLELGAIDDSDIVWFNGVRVGSLAEAFNTPRKYTIKSALVKPGPATIVVFAIDSGGAGGLIGPAPSMQLGRSDAHGTNATSIPLAGDWLWRQGSPHTGARPPAAPTPQEPGRSPRDYAAMHNGMISAFAPYGVRGAIWYQGESNANEPEAYRDFLPLLINDWATTFQRGTFPFGVVQLAAFRPFAANKPAQGEWALLREAQSYAAKTVEDVGIVVTTDIGDANDIHPRKKREVGRRLSLWALATVYDLAVDSYSGPIFKSATPRTLSDGRKALVINFDHADGGLALRDKASLGGFAIAGEDGVFHWASAKITGENEVTLTSPDVVDPKSVRYAWQNNPEPANLVNGFGLPADGFRFP